MRLQHDSDFAGTQLDEVAGGVDAQQLHEAADQVLVELHTVIPLQDREDPIGRKGLLVEAL